MLKSVILLSSREVILLLLQFLIPVGPDVLDRYFIMKNLNVEICVWAGSVKSAAPTFNSLQSLIDFI